ncbi:MAG: hypothetical protein Kow0063_26130 [Anaerolineae bacterium]
MTNSANLESQVRSYLRRGILAARGGDYTGARRWLEAALDRDPDNITALLWLAWLAPGRQESLILLSRVLELDPGNERARAGIRWARRRPLHNGAVRSDTPDGQTLVDGQGEGQQPAPPEPKHPGRAEFLQEALDPAEAQAKARSGITAQRARRLIGLLGLLLAVALCLLAGTSLMAWYFPTTVLAWMLPTPPQMGTDTPGLVESPAASATTSQSPDPIVSATRATATVTPSPSPTATPVVPPAPSPTATPVPPVLPTSTVSAPADGDKWIDVDLTAQQLTAYQGSEPVFQTTVSTGLPNTPTVVGQFRIYWKLKATDMAGPGYYLPDVPYTMYFHAGYALHGTYWHSNFGRPMSHGCVNLRTEDAQWLFEWADPPLPAGTGQVRSSNSNPGTLVVVHY